MNFKKDSEASGGQMTLFSLEASHNYVNHTHQQESDLVKKMRDTSGRRCLERYARFNHVGLWAKTFSDLLIGMEGWYSTKCKLTWKLKGTKYNRMYFQLYPSTHHTEGTGFGLLPTPMAMDSTNATATMKSTQVKEGSMHSVTLSMAVSMGILPTPNTRDWKDSIGNGKDAPSIGVTRGYSLGQKINSMLPTPIAGDWKGQLRSDGTANMLSGKMALLHKQGMLPTPTASVIKHGHSEKYWDNRIGKKQMDIAMWNAETNGKTSQLSPQFVLEMMGFPTDWTLLPFLNGEMSQSKQEEMQ